MSNRAPNDYALGHNHEELQRLIGQSRFLGELTEQVLRAAGIGPDMRVLDVGCGAGDVSFLASRRTFRHGIATAAEIDVDTLAARLQRAVQAADATVVAPLFVGAWARKP
jgi:SAM-dependent methyltransferase